MTQGEAGNIPNVVGNDIVIVGIPRRQYMRAEPSVERDVACLGCGGVACTMTTCLLCPFPFNIVWGVGTYIITKISIFSRVMRYRTTGR